MPADTSSVTSNGRPESDARACGRRLDRAGAALLLILLLAVVGYGRLGYAPARREQLREEWRIRLGATAEDRRRALDAWLEEMHGDTRMLARFPAVAEWAAGTAGTAGLAHLRAVLDGAGEDEGHDGVWLLGADGAPVIAPGAPAWQASRSMVIEFSRRVVEQAGSVAILADAAGAPVILFGAPVLHDGRAVGALVIEAYAREFVHDLLAAQPLPTRTGETVLVSDVGDSVLFLSPLRHRPQQAALTLRLPHSPQLAASVAASGAAVFGAFTDYRGQPVLAGTRRLERAPWGVVAKVDAAEAFAPVRTDVVRYALVSGALLLSLTLLLLALRGYHRSTLGRAGRESEARHRTLFETSPQGVIYRDLATGARTLNPAACALLGITPEEANQDLLAHVELWDERGRRLTDTDLSSTRAGAAGEPVEPRVVRAVNRRTGAVRWLLSGARPLYRDGQTRPYLVYTIFTDITALREAEAELRETREMYRAVVENTTDVIARFDRDCRYLFINPACQRYAPLSAADLIGRTHREAGHEPEISERWDRSIRAVFADGKPREESYTLPGPNGLQHFAWRLFPEFDADGRVQTVVTWSSDVTAQRLLEAQYQQAQKMEAVGRLAGGVAHDFNNLITAISGYGMMVLDQLPAGSAERADVEEIVRASDRAAALTRQLLAFSRKQVLKVDVLDLGGVLHGMEKMLRRLIGEDVRLRLEVEPGLWRVLADPGQVEQVVMNLAVNARDAMPGGGTLTIALRNAPLPRGSQRHDPAVAAGEYVVLEVRDTGAGMSAATLEHLFEPFFTTKDKGKGTGLGLSTVYGIVRQSDGAIAVDSAPGAGTRFEILLPRAAGAAAEPAVHPAGAASERTGERILVVEDEPAVRLLAQRMLERAGYRVQLAESGDEALKLEFPPGSEVDLLLTDVVMPGMSGGELARRFVERHPGVKVLFMSGYTDDVIASHGLLEPGVSLLQKPFTLHALQQAVRATLDRNAALW